MPIAALPAAEAVAGGEVGGAAATGLLRKVPLVGKVFGGGHSDQPAHTPQSAAAYTQQTLNPHQFG